jgi:hypothetical protein
MLVKNEDYFVHREVCGGVCVNSVEEMGVDVFVPEYRKTGVGL